MSRLDGDLVSKYQAFKLRAADLTRRGQRLTGEPDMPAEVSEQWLEEWKEFEGERQQLVRALAESIPRLATAMREWDAFLDQQAALVPRLQALTLAPYRSTDTGPAVCESVREAVAELLEFAAQGCPEWPPVDADGKLGEPFKAYLEALRPSRSAAFAAWSARCEQVELVAELLMLPEEQVLPVVLLYEARPDLAPQPDPGAAKVGMN